MEENAQSRPNYYAIIPADVRYDDAIPAAAKLLYGEISALCNREGYCYATNQYFAGLYQVSERTIRDWLNALDGRKYIRRADEPTGKGDTKRRVIYLSVSAPHGQGEENNFQGGGKDFPPGAEENCRQNNINNNKKESKKKKTEKPEPLSAEEMQPIFVELIEQVATLDWTREQKNRVYLELIAFYEPRERGKMDPSRTETGIRRQFRALVRYANGNPDTMAELLEKSTAIGSRGVIDPNKSWSRPRPAEDPGEADGVLHL